MENTVVNLTLCKATVRQSVIHEGSLQPAARVIYLHQRSRSIP